VYQTQLHTNLGFRTAQPSLTMLVETVHVKYSSTRFAISCYHGEDRFCSHILWTVSHNPHSPQAFPKKI